MIGSTDLTTSLAEAVVNNTPMAAQTPATQAPPPKPISPLDVFANVKAALSTASTVNQQSSTLLLHKPPRGVVSTALEKSDPTDNSGTGWKSGSEVAQQWVPNGPGPGAGDPGPGLPPPTTPDPGPPPTPPPHTNKQPHPKPPAFLNQLFDSFTTVRSTTGPLVVLRP